MARAIVLTPEARTAPTVRLNLGCGRRPLPGYVNVDLRPSEGVDVVLDVAQTPWPWETASAVEVRAHALFEHLSGWERVLLECARVLRPGGALDVLVPYGWRGIAQPYHVRAFVETTFDYFIDNEMERTADLRRRPVTRRFSLEPGPRYFHKELVEKRHYYPFSWHLAQRLGEWVYRVPLARTRDLRVVLRRNDRPWEGA